ncbi:helix-turn-helix domain-containing protein [Streptomyces sp. NPDC020917]|uniref:helix-turn-helix domain-containing protein n=1 Tax=Streptomyces sp. NPDC020917 TaxID=3365102 RepID=UPI003795A3FF
MGQDQQEPGEALLGLRRRLEDGRASARLTKTQLATKAEVSRTTVYEALRPDGPVPSLETVAALAKVLRLPVQELLELRRRAAPPAEEPSGPGRPLAQWDPHDLEVHPAGDAGSGPAGVRKRRVLASYVGRTHDQALAEAVREAAAGRSQMVVLVGSSSTGKTRACWEAVQPLADRGWRLWHPFDPTRADAALKDLHRVGPRTVVWLNEAQHYLGDPVHGELTAAALHRLLTAPECAPVLVLGTLWPEYAERYGALPVAGEPDPHSRTRELLSGRRLTVLDTFDNAALATARSLAAAGDDLLAGALNRAAAHGRLAQDLAGAPELLQRYEEGTPAARAILQAAMDARRLGVGLDLSQSFLTDAACDYLTDTDFQHLTEDWAEAAYAELARPVHGRQAPLHRNRPRPARDTPMAPPLPTTPAPSALDPVLRLADYLEQHGRASRRGQCPPASFWHAAHTYLRNPRDLCNLSEAARGKHRLQWAHHLVHRAADAGSSDALIRLAEERVEAREWDTAEELLRRAVDAGNPDGLLRLAKLRQRAGDRAEAQELVRRAADGGDPIAPVHLADRRGKASDREATEAPAQRAAGARDPGALQILVHRREKTSDREAAEALAQQVADAGYPIGLLALAELREEDGDRDAAEALVHQAADAGNLAGLVWLAELREKYGDRDTAEALLRRAVDAGDFAALLRLTTLLEKAGDRDGAEALVQQAADAANSAALRRLATLREKTGDRDGAEALLRRAADAEDRSFGQNGRIDYQRLWPYGLNPDGTRTAPWS